MLDKMKERLSRQMIIWIIILILIALLSNLLVSKIVTDPSYNAKVVESLDEKKLTVMKLAAGAAASSTALSFLPGDTASPIANELAELSKYFLVILSAIVLEKVLIAVVGYVSFSYIIPISCILGILYLLLEIESFRNLAIKLGIFGMVIFVAIPASIKVSDIIYSSHQASLEQTMETANENNEYIDEKKEEFAEEDKNWIGQISGYLSNLTSDIGFGLSDIVKRAEDTFNNYLDAIAILLITTCVIPLVVILFFVWITRILFGFDIRLSKKH